MTEWTPTRHEAARDLIAYLRDVSRLNEWWAMSSGEHLNTADCLADELDDALTEIERLAGEVMRLARELETNRW